VRRGEAPLGKAELSSTRRKHRVVYSCVIARTCFEVTVLTWSKYATLLSLLKVVLPEQPNGHLFFLPRALLATSLSYGSVLVFSRGGHLPTTTYAPFLRPPRPERFHDKFTASPGYHNHLMFSYLHSLTLSLSTVRL
jgi:hypothetical protein